MRQSCWNSVTVQWRDKDGYVDAGSIRAAFKRQVGDYLRLERTIEYVSEISRVVELPPGLDAVGAPLTVENALVQKNTEGTWIHPRVAIDLARWLSPTFAVWMGDWFIKRISQEEPQCDFKRPLHVYKKQFYIADETDLHYRVVAYVRRFHPNAIVVAGLGELQTTESKRIDAWKKGYLRGQPDLMILNHHKTWTGLAVELKHPGFDRDPQPAQKQVLSCLEREGWLAIVSNDYDEVCRALDEYLRELVPEEPSR